MTGFFMKKSLPKLAAVAAALACMGSAQALVLTFDDAIDTTLAPFAPLFGHGDAIVTQGFYVAGYSTKGGAGAGDLVAALVDGTDVANTCTGLVCPAGNATKFLVGLNDGLPDISRVGDGEFKVNSFDASFVAASGDAVLSGALLLQVEGYSASALLYSQQFSLPGPVNGGYTFASYTLSAANAATSVVEIAFRAYACTTPTTCSRSLDKAQFALDNFNAVVAVPEPSAWLMLGLGLGLVGVAAQVRRRSAA